MSSTKPAAGTMATLDDWLQAEAEVVDDKRKVIAA
jgi:hypothetical protein